MHQPITPQTNNDIPHSHSLISRRVLLLGLAGIGGLAAVGASFLREQSSPPTKMLSRSSSSAPWHYIEEIEIPNHLGGHIGQATWSSNGAFLALNTLREEQGILVWEMQTGKQLFQQAIQSFGCSWSPQRSSLALLPTPDSSLFHTLFPNPLIIYDFPSGQQHASYTTPVSHPSTLSWSPDGKRMTCARYSIEDSNTVVSWDALTGGNRLIYQAADLPGDIMPEQVYWSPNRKYLTVSFSPDSSSSSPYSVGIWEADTAKVVFTAGGACSWSPNGPFIVCHIGDHNEVREMPTGKLISTYHIDGPAVWSPQGNILVAADKQYLDLWNPLTGKRLARNPIVGDQAPLSIAWSPLGNVLVTADDQHFDYWDATGKHLASMPISSKQEGFSSISWFPDGKRIALLQNSSSITVWEPSTNRQIIYDGHTKAHDTVVTDLVWSPNGKEVVSLGSSPDRGSMQIWPI